EDLPEKIDRIGLIVDYENTSEAGRARWGLGDDAFPRGRPRRLPQPAQSTATYRRRTLRPTVTSPILSQRDCAEQNHARFAIGKEFPLGHPANIPDFEVRNRAQKQG